MWTASFKRAWSDTCTALGWPPNLFYVLPIPVVGLAYHWSAQGRIAMLPELFSWVIYGLAATGTVFLAVFLWNLAAAPYRIEKSRRIKLSEMVGMNEGAIDAFYGRSEFTINEVTNLLSRDHHTKELVFDDLVRGIISGRLEPIITDRMSKLRLQIARSTQDHQAIRRDHMITLLPRDKICDFLIKSGYSLPQWLQDKKTRKPQ